MQPEEVIFKVDVTAAGRIKDGEDSAETRITFGRTALRQMAVSPGRKLKY